VTDRTDAGDEIECQEQHRHTLTTGGDTVLIRQSATAFATALGFDDQTISEIGIVAAELAENVHKHAEGGEIAIGHITDGEREGIRIESEDAGPGLQDVEAAFGDGTSTAGTLGGGLGAVNRLMDRVTVSMPGEPDFGTQIIADRWRKPVYEQSVTPPSDIGAASRPLSSGEPNGDSFVIKSWNDKALVGVIDGLGHGLPAHKAATAARSYIESHYDQPFTALFEGTGRACRGTRGVVMALARFDWADETVEFAGIGNIVTKLSGPDRGSLVTRRGVVGSNAPDPYIEEFGWNHSDRLALHSDGLSSRWDWEEYTELERMSATEQAQELLDQFSNNEDDSTVLVVTPREQS